MFNSNTKRIERLERKMDELLNILHIRFIGSEKENVCTKTGHDNVKSLTLRKYGGEMMLAVPQMVGCYFTDKTKTDMCMVTEVEYSNALCSTVVRFKEVRHYDNGEYRVEKYQVDAPRFYKWFPYFSSKEAYEELLNNAFAYFKTLKD